jgi:hypothetical protein
MRNSRFSSLPYAPQVGGVSPGNHANGQEDHEFPIILFRFSSTIRGDARSLVPGTG